MTSALGDRLPKIGRALSLAGAVLGLIDLAGWLRSGNDILVGVIPDRPPMMPNTALLLAMVGIAAVLRSRETAPRWQRGLSTAATLMVLLAAGALLVEYIFHTDLGIDQLLVHVTMPGPFPGRTAPATAVALLMLGGALLVFDTVAPRGAHPREWLALIAATLAFAALVGHLYGAADFYRLEKAPSIGVSLHTGTAVFLIASGILLVRPTMGMMRLFTSEGPAGLIARRLGGASVLTPIAVGVTLACGRTLAELNDLHLALALLTTAMAVISSALVALAVAPLERSHNALEESRAGYRELLEQAPEGIFVTDNEGRYTDVNGAGCRLLQCSREEIVGKTITDFILPRDAQRLEQAKEELVVSGVYAGEWQMRQKGGRIIPVEVSAKILPGGRWQGFLRDQTQQRAHLAQQRYFARMGDILASTLDHHEMMTLVARASLPFLGDACGMLLVANDQPTVEIFRAGETHDARARDLARYEAETSDSLLRQSLKTKKPVLIQELSIDLLRSVAQSDEHLRLLEWLGPESLVAVPLLAHGRCHGALTFVSTSSSRRYGAADLHVAEELGRRVALAIDNALLYEQLRLQGTITAHLAEGILLVRADDERIVYTNPRFDEMFGYAPNELVGREVSVLNAPGELSPQEVADEIHWQLRTTGVWHGEIENIKKDGTRFWCYASVSTFDQPRLGAVWVAVRTDITERKRMEEERRLALAEKEALLKEIHHRVKNNLQVVSSLFYLQAQRTKDEQLRQLLDESRGRIQSIALVHEHLYRSSSLARIDFAEYLRSLVAGIEATYGAWRICVRVFATEIFLDIRHAVPCGLVVSELTSNALKHAFPEERAGKVSVTAMEDEEKNIIVEVADDGVGLPEGVDFTSNRTLGLQLVQSLTSQIRGSLSLDRSSGTRVTLRFR